MSKANAYLLLSLDEQRYALPVAAVERVIRAVAVTHLPEAPETVLGVINVAGQILQVIDLSKKLGLPRRSLSPDRRFVIVTTPRRPVVLMVDGVEEIIHIPEQTLVAASSFLSAPGALRGLTINDDEIVLIENPDLLLAAVDTATQMPSASIEHQGDDP